MWMVVCTVLYLTTVGQAENIADHERKESIVSNVSPNKHVLKRYDQDYQTCLENFEIRDDKIIRTQDSREMGAKYITEFDLSSREECLRACCGTETCDVFVFEEKNPGSCYLFHCGPADDFKCKFTKHHNYTSAILQASRHTMSELESQIKLTKHEQELSRLRKPALAMQVTGAPVLTTSLPGSSNETVLSSPNNASASTNRHCSTYQFECRGSNECIAIYNACDGIPQCADGSDEAPELACPTQGTTAVPMAPARQTVPPQVNSNSASNQNPSLLLGTNYNSLGDTIQANDMKSQMQFQKTSLLDNKQVVNNEFRNNGAQPFRAPPHSGWQQPLSMQAQQTPQYSGLNQGTPGKMFDREGEVPVNNYNSQWNYQHEQSNQYSGSSLGSHPYDDRNIHIFNHKGSGLMADSDRSQGQYDNNRPDYNGKYSGNGNVGSNMYYNNGPYRQPSQQSDWPRQQNQQATSRDFNPIANLGDGIRNDNDRKMPLPPDYYYEDNQAQDARIHPLPENDQHTYQHPPSEIGGVPPSDPIIKHPQEQPREVFKSTLEKKLEQDLSSKPPTKEDPVVHKTHENLSGKESANITIKDSKRKPTKEMMAEKDRDGERLVKGDSISMALDEFDSDVAKPKGAILSLSLGMCICAIFITLVSCRVRMIRKRLRRGGKSPYTHDADYLVNGMYL